MPRGAARVYTCARPKMDVGRGVIVRGVGVGREWREGLVESVPSLHENNNNYGCGNGVFTEESRESGLFFRS
jgi:hypothetical protein